MRHVPKKLSTLTLGLSLICSNVAWAGGKNVAVIDREATDPLTDGQRLCQLLVANGHSCTLFPKTGPTAPLDPFDVAVDLSAVWSDPGGTLADFMRAGKTVIIYHDAALALGIESNTTVQAWIGATEYINGANFLYSVASDPILGDLPPGTWLGDCSAGSCGALRGVSPSAKVLATYTDFDDPEPGGILRNVWEGGVSVFLTQYIDNNEDEIMLNAVRARELTIPTLSETGLCFLAAITVLAGACILARRNRSPRPESRFGS